MSNQRRKFIATLASTSAFLGFRSPCHAQASLCSETSAGSDDRLANTDVLVVGGGPAGIAAAIASAKSGVRTLLLESHGFFGGVAAWGMGMCMNQMRPSGKPRGCIHELLLKNLQTYGDQAVRVSDHQFLVNVEYLKAALLDSLDQFGVTYLVHAKVVDALTKGDAITGVVIATKTGLRKISAKVVIDCSGDADVAYFAGAPTLMETGNLSPQTLLFNVGNIQENKRQDLVAAFEKARGKYPLIPHGWSLKQVANSHYYYVNHSGTKTHGNFDITDIRQFTEAECLSRRQVVQMVQAMREFGDGEFKQIELVGAGPQIGVRESRRIQGSYLLSEQDAINGSRFDDAIAWRSGWLDIGFTRLTQMRIHQVPYRCLIPEKVEGLLAAGRCISTTHAGLSAGKSMGNCIATGHAAGVSAALSLKYGTLPRQLEVKAIQAVLAKDDVNLSIGGEEQSKEMEN